MDYEKKYKEALEGARIAHKDEDRHLKATLERIFPELAESEDDRIRNEIIAFVVQSIHRGGGTPIPEEQETKWIAWLEKQGEHKPAWSEEDEKRIERIYRRLWAYRKGDTDEIYQIEQDANWLKSLKDRLQPQPKQEWSEEELEFINTPMTTSELLVKLPSHIGRNCLHDEHGNVIGYISDTKHGGDMGWLYLHNDGRDWCASYGTSGEYVCMNPDDEEPPYNNAAVYGSTPHEALKKLYDWCIENGFIKK